MHFNLFAKQQHPSNIYSISRCFTRSCVLLRQLICLALWFLMHKTPKTVAHSTIYTCIVLADSSILQTNTFGNHNNQSTTFYVHFNIWIFTQLWNRNAIDLNFFHLKQNVIRFVIYQWKPISNEDRKLNFQNSNHSRNNDKHSKIISIICSGM